ncbi:MAG TPA: hypothetical protein VFN10_06365 [Thermoanaerobaculia bacterium]|nr:hypothetical protein [Thermoanaerobaculia bacterium]
MARGWESKSVEAQQDEPRSAYGRREEPTAEQRERDSKRQSLEMSKRRIERELDGSRSDVHRTALKNALAHLDQEISRLR